jgi:predicted nucleic acid-binding protein
MIHIYFDSGVLLKLYTAESDSPQVQDFIYQHRIPLHVTSLHLAEFASALNQKVFRRECELRQVQAALALVKERLAGKYPAAGRIRLGAGVSKLQSTFDPA